MNLSKKASAKELRARLTAAAWRTGELATIQCLVARARARAELELAGVALRASRLARDPAEAAVNLEQGRRALLEAKRASHQARIYDAEARARSAETGDLGAQLRRRA